MTGEWRNKWMAGAAAAMLLAHPAPSLAASATAGADSASGSGVDFGKHDTKKPIDITSDKLEVLQDESKAIFSGNVLAVQGDMKLKSDSMTVHYRKGAGNGGGDKRDAVSKIDVSGNVFLTTTQETASGNSGTYDVDA